MTDALYTSDKEVTFHSDDFIVSKTDLKGRITYCNDVFLKVSGYTENEILGQSHNFIRHPDMPRSVFHLLWETISAENEIFAYVKNITKTGDYYWVLAHVTPSYDMARNHIGYHSNRRVAKKTVLTDVIIPLYTELSAIERESSNAKEGMHAACLHLQNVLEGMSVDYREFISKLAFAA